LHPAWTTPRYDCRAASLPVWRFLLFLVPIFSISPVPPSPLFEAPLGPPLPFRGVFALLSFPGRRIRQSGCCVFSIPCSLQPLVRDTHQPFQQQPSFASSWFFVYVPTNKYGVSAFPPNPTFLFSGRSFYVPYTTWTRTCELETLSATGSVLLFFALF